MFDKLIHKYFRIPYRLHVGLNHHVKDEKNTIIFLHGIASSSHAWSKFVRELGHDPKFANSRIVCIDLLGFGKSPYPEWMEYTTDDHLRSLRRTIRKLHIRTPLYLVGHSMGAILSAEYANTYGDIRALALISPPFVSHDERPSFHAKFHTKLLATIDKFSKTKHVGVVGAIASTFSTFESRYVKRKSFTSSLNHVIIEGNSWETVRSLTIPTAIIHGRFDPLVDRENLASLGNLKHIAFTEVLDGHDLFGHKQTASIEQLKILLDNP